MASTELEVRRPELPSAADMNAAAQYAERLSGSLLLPKQYFKQPANVLYAIEYGRMIGLAPMAAIIGVHVIEGKPSASAALISALVRRAGHKLRVRGDAKSATAQIIRADDPGYTFEVTFTIEDAHRAELTKKAVWKNYPASMLKARAITQCARDACEEALLGMHYTPEELGAEVDAEGEPVYTAEQVAVAVVRKAEREMVDIAPRGQTNPIDPDFELPATVGTASAMGATGPQLQKLNILIGEKRGNLPRPEKLALVASFVGRELASSRELTLREASELIERLMLEPNHVTVAEIVPDAPVPDSQLGADYASAIEEAADETDLDVVMSAVDGAVEGGQLPPDQGNALLVAATAKRRGWSHRTAVGAGMGS
jgi:hypothetical protein